MSSLPCCWDPSSTKQGKNLSLWLPSTGRDFSWCDAYITEKSSNTVTGGGSHNDFSSYLLT
eukprot:11974330-Ditylum_brightwellii.AAC.1